MYSTSAVCSLSGSTYPKDRPWAGCGVRKSIRSAVVGSNDGRRVRTNQPRKCCWRVVRAGGSRAPGRESKAQRARKATGRPAPSRPRTSAPPATSRTDSTVAPVRTTALRPASRAPTSASKSRERSILYRKGTGRPSVAVPSGPCTRSRSHDAVSAESNAPSGASQ